MWCLKRKLKNIFICDHAICDTCVEIFEKKSLNMKYQYQFKKSFLCFSEILKITLKFSTIEIKIFNINDDKSWNVMFLKLLKSLQNIVEHNYSIQTLFDLTFKISFDIFLFNIWLEQFINVLKKRFDNFEFFFVNKTLFSARNYLIV